MAQLLAVIASSWLARPYKRLAQARQELIDAMAHGMRTPLTAILGGVRLLERAKLGDDRRQQILATMGREARRLTDMDERLLMLTRLEHKSAHYTTFSSLEMAEEALAVFEHVTLCGEDAAFTAERDLLVQLMRNLVVNAQRAGGDKPVCVRLRKNGFSVEDRGCGMTPEGIQAYASAVFDKETGKPVKLSILHDKDFDIDQFPDSTDHITQAMVDEVTGQIETEMGLVDITWHAMRDMPTTTNWGLCLPLRAVVGDGWLLTVYIGCDDGQAHGLDLTYGTLVDVLPVEVWKSGR